MQLRKREAKAAHKNQSARLAEEECKNDGPPSAPEQGRCGSPPCHAPASACAAARWKSLSQAHQIARSAANYQFAPG